MSEKLPVLSGRELLKILMKIGFVPVRQRGSHVFLRHQDGRRTVVPMHDEVNKSTLMDILAEIKITKEEFLKLA
ncbi:MAG: type II toxin-antitoxin system HicA family toxin [Nitrososphaerales archaeon]